MREHEQPGRRAAPGPSRPAPPRPEGTLLDLQRTAGNAATRSVVYGTRSGGDHGRGAAVSVQRVETEAPTTGQGADRDAATVIARLSASIIGGSSEKSRKSAKAMTVKAADLLTGGVAELGVKAALTARLPKGPPFSEQDLSDIAALARIAPKWLDRAGIGTIAAAQEYRTKKDYRGWLKLDPGHRILVATLAFAASSPGTRSADEAIPIAPDYTLGRTHATYDPAVLGGETALLLAERDTQIRETAVDTLDPKGARSYDAGRARHDAGDRMSREVLTNVLVLLRHGLQIYDSSAGAHRDYREGDVIRAIAHGGRVSIRIPALTGDQTGAELPEYLRSIGEGGLPDGVTTRGNSTHRIATTKNTADERGSFEERGGTFGAGAHNLVSPSRPEMSQVNAAIGGSGTLDWNGDVVLPDGTHGQLLMVFHRPTRDTDGGLMIGLETLGKGAKSPVGYKHDWRSSEATANPESSLHGHKVDKIGDGKLADNGRFVDLAEVGKRNRDDGDWHAFLEAMRSEWIAKIEATEEGTEERRRLYRELMGPRPPGDDAQQS